VSRPHVDHHKGQLSGIDAEARAPHRGRVPREQVQLDPARGGQSRQAAEQQGTPGAN
jgi:hypothetical protein